MSRPSLWESDVVLVDGGTAHLRPLTTDDQRALSTFYEGLSEESVYFRFFSPVSGSTAARLERLPNPDDRDHVVLGAELGDRLIAVARYDRVGTDDAEVAFAVSDEEQRRGLATLMLEHLAVVARANGIATFSADTLPTNSPMLNVFRDAGFELEHSFETGSVHLRFSIEPTEGSLAAVEAREARSEAESIARLLSPRSIVVVGAGRASGTIGHELFRNLIAYDFRGAVYPVNRVAASVAGVRAYPSVLDVPDVVDLVIVAVPAREVAQVVADAAERRARGLVIITAGFAEAGASGADDQRALVSVARRNGMRIIGPNCLGVVNTSPEVQMNATFAPGTPVAGNIGFLSQSGGLGIELMARAGELGLGVSEFVAVGNKADVSGNDLLQHWEQDERTEVILLYLESFGNPRKFARLARRVSRAKPIIAVKSGRTVAGSRAASSHTAALAAPDVAVDALFAQAGVIRVDTLEDLLGTAMVLAHQPLPKGRRVAIVSNAGGPGILAADACAGAGLEVPELSEDTQRRLREFVAADASVHNPIDLVAGATADDFGRALRVVLDGNDADALVVIFTPPLVTRADDVAAAIARAAADAGETPIVACFLGRTGSPPELCAAGARRTIPSFAFPEDAVRALGRGAELAAWRSKPAGVVPELDDVDVEAARTAIATALAARPEGGWLDIESSSALLSCFGVSIAPARLAFTQEAAVAAADDLGFPVALKAAAPDLVHKTDVGGVALHLGDGVAVADAFSRMHARLGDAMGGAVVQPMVRSGIETIVGSTHDPAFGPLVLFGMGGVAAELLADHALRIVPLTTEDAREQVRSLRSSPLLFGYRGSRPMNVEALEELLVRVGILVDEIPEVAEMDLNPVIVDEDGVIAVDAKIRIEPAPVPIPRDFRRMRVS
jgi:acetyl coenzyme A synthetase (ADP forming)-like protein